MSENSRQSEVLVGTGPSAARARRRHLRARPSGVTRPAPTITVVDTEDGEHVRVTLSVELLPADAARAARVLVAVARSLGDPEPS